MLIYPEKTPDYITIRPPDYSGFKDEFETSDFIRYPSQFYVTGYSFLFKYANICRDDLDILIAFHNDLQKENNRVFTIPSLVFKNFPLFLKQRIFCNNDYWVIKDPVMNITPKIVNTRATTYALELTVMAVIA